MADTPPDRWPPEPNALPNSRFRPIHPEPNPFQIVPCCDRGRAAFVSRYGGKVSIIEDPDGPGVSDIVFCPWCGKRFEVLRDGALPSGPDRCGPCYRAGKECNKVGRYCHRCGSDETLT